MTTWRITKFDSPYLVSVNGPDTGGAEVGPVTRALKAEAEVKELTEAMGRLRDELDAARKQRDLFRELYMEWRDECDRLRKQIAEAIGE